ncbi:hypothetical protein MalM25_09880 [Planctomycetes bacterium MalM25]|nr:hypothetical protein MalM25_09880 [Planctomycetes bacterium MalM25]
MNLDRSRWLTPTDTPMWIGLDVGGANLKAADGRAVSVSEPFELWKRPDDLPEAVQRLLAKFDLAPIALTMTGELADCFATKGEGVRAIVDAVTEASGGREVRVATVDDRWLTPGEAKSFPPLVAAANWRVAARLVASTLTTDSAAWIDAGSTTIDVIPLRGGRVASRGATDTERLLNGELVYTGVRRTPVCAVVVSLPYRGDACPVAAEWFATTADAWLLLGELDADPTNTETADGRPFTPEASVARLARCFGADSETFTREDAQQAAEAIANAQQQTLLSAMTRASLRSELCVLSGEGEFLARRALEGRYQVFSLQKGLGPKASHPLPAHAAAVLASIELGSQP